MSLGSARMLREVRETSPARETAVLGPILSGTLRRMLTPALVLTLGARNAHVDEGGEGGDEGENGEVEYRVWQWPQLRVSS
jgi:hypothetical protein